MIKKTIELNFRVLQNSNDTFFAIANSIGTHNDFLLFLKTQKVKIIVVSYNIVFLLSFVFC